MALAGVTDALLAAAWTAVLLPALAAGMGAAAGRLAALAVLLAAACWLEAATGGRPDVPPAAAAAGVVLAAAGAVLHRRARRALGGAFTTRVAVPPDSRIVREGPYRVVRHPVYAAVLLVAAGTALARPSLPALCLPVGLAAGVALKIRREEALLARTCGPAWRGYAARVPAILPRLRRAAP